MKLKTLYEAILTQGAKNDPRGSKGIKAYLLKVKSDYDKLSPLNKKLFDKEKLTIPFPDTRILYGNPNKNIKNILVGIDMDTPELLLAKTLSKKKKIDLVMSHHPGGFGLSALYQVMHLQLDILKSLGVDEKKAKKLLDERIEDVSRKLHPGNVMRVVDSAKLLDMPLMCAHTAADNCVQGYLSKLFKSKKPKTVQDIIDLLSQEKEYQNAITIGTGPKVTLGKATNKCGKIIIEMTGGTGGPKKIFKELAKANVKTIVAMHMGEENFKEAKKLSKKHKFNILIAGHIASDNLGMNILLDNVDKKGELNIIPTSGFVRVKRKR